MELTHAAATFSHALVVGDPRAARVSIAEAAATGADLATIYETIITPAMYEVGRLWEGGRLTVAQEHLATAIASSQLDWLATVQPAAAATDRVIVLAAAPGEQHVLATRMLASLLGSDGWTVISLGASSSAEIAEAVRMSRSTLVALSTTMRTLLADARDTIDALHRLPDRAFVLVGGRAYDDDPETASSVGADAYARSVSQARVMLAARTT